MWDYRKVLRSKEFRLRCLSLMGWLPDKLMLGLQYYLQTGERLHLYNPKKFNEFLQVYKLCYRNPLMQQCVDKYEVRDFVKNRKLNPILVPLIGVYDKIEDIDFDKLPDKFIVKTTDGGGSCEVKIVRNKRSEDIEELKNEIKKWLRRPKPHKHIAREWAYENDYPRRIIIEELLEENNGTPDIDDYKFFCYNGKFRVLEWHKDRTTNHSAAHYDENLNFLPEFYTYKVMHQDHPLPDNIKDMVRIAEKLSEGFPFVRVDLYNVKGKIYFGEMTFYPASGYFVFRPDEVNIWLGSFFKGTSIDFAGK